jgi:hypothetical protein
MWSAHKEVELVKMEPLLVDIQRVSGLVGCRQAVCCKDAEEVSVAVQAGGWLWEI